MRKFHLCNKCIYFSVCIFDRITEKYFFCLMVLNRFYPRLQLFRLFVVYSLSFYPSTLINNLFNGAWRIRIILISQKMANLKNRLYQSNVTEITAFKALLFRSFIIYKKFLFSAIQNSSWKDFPNSVAMLPAKNSWLITNSSAVNFPSCIRQKVRLKIA